jgi:hypothetical protein
MHRLSGDDPPSSQRLRLTRPIRRPEDRERFLSGLRKAGLPD